MSKTLAEIVELVRRETGNTLSAGRHAFVDAALRRAAPDLDSAGFLSAVSDRVRGRDLIERLIDEVTVQETAFLRDGGQLVAISWPGLLRSARASGSRTIRVWSAGCSTGEEPYTLALLAAEAFAPARAPVDVLGTDVSGAALAAATAGRYRERAVRALDEPLRSRYLDRNPDDGYLVDDGLRRLVRFRRHNLAKGPIPPSGETGFDLIVCRNVLIYFQQTLTGQVITALERSLCPGGTLMLGAADALRRPVARPGVTAASPPGRLAREGRAPGPAPGGSRERRLAAALDAAGHGDRSSAMAQLAALLTEDPLDSDAHFLHGLVRLEAGDPLAAAVAFRRALCTDGSFALAAFALGRARDALGDQRAARRAYERALRTLDPEDQRHEAILSQVDIGDIAAACLARLGGRA
ncbi:MAG TPA: CheR family methyltransferase [Streptosporangiaceae bacterium]|nr:CheR family methyltransferase [Streptosporangiaceae bacterium]